MARATMILTVEVTSRTTPSVLKRDLKVLIENDEFKVKGLTFTSSAATKAFIKNQKAYSQDPNLSEDVNYHHLMIEAEALVVIYNHPKTAASLNSLFNKLGIKERVFRDSKKHYCYFGEGDAATWNRSGVSIERVSNWSYRAWLMEYLELSSDRNQISNEVEALG